MHKHSEINPKTINDANTFSRTQFGDVCAIEMWKFNFSPIYCVMLKWEREKCWPKLWIENDVSKVDECSDDDYDDTDDDDVDNDQNHSFQSGK